MILTELSGLADHVPMLTNEHPTLFSCTLGAGLRKGEESISGGGLCGYPSNL